MKCIKLIGALGTAALLSACGNRSDETAEASRELIPLEDVDASTDEEMALGVDAEDAVDGSEGSGNDNDATSDLNITSGPDYGGDAASGSDTMIRGESSQAIDPKASKLIKADPAQ